MKCILIVSQYYGDIQGFIVNYKMTSDTHWKKFLCDMEDYKRTDEERKRAYYFGDFNRFDELDGRYNVNDVSGDFYVFSCPSVEYAIEQLEEVKKRNKRAIPKRLKGAVSEHHERYELEEIVERHFEIL